MGQTVDTEISEVVDLILSDYADDRSVNKIDINNQPDKQAIVDVVEKMMKILYPGYYSDKVYRIAHELTLLGIPINQCGFQRA